MECTTATILNLIKGFGWEFPPCPHLQWLDKLGHDVVVRLHSKSGYSAFHVKYNPNDKEFTCFRALDPLEMLLRAKEGL